MPAPPLAFERRIDPTKTLMILLAVWAALLAAWLWLEAAWWLMLAIGLFTLPALRDLIRLPRAGLALTEDKFTWYTGRFEGAVERAEIDHIRLDTRLDFSVRASVVLTTGRKIRLPQDAIPPHRTFEADLNAHGIDVKRFHFQLFG